MSQEEHEQLKFFLTQNFFSLFIADFGGVHVVLVLVTWVIRTPNPLNTAKSPWVIYVSNFSPPVQPLVKKLLELSIKSIKLKTQKFKKGRSFLAEKCRAKQNTEQGIKEILGFFFWTSNSTTEEDSVPAIFLYITRLCLKCSAWKGFINFAWKKFKKKILGPKKKFVSEKNFQKKIWFWKILV